MVEVLYLMGFHDAEEFHERAVRGGAGILGCVDGELAGSFQGGDGGHEEGFVARPFLAAGDGLVNRVLFVAVLGSGNGRL
jgi:hypothetical protein